MDRPKDEAKKTHSKTHKSSMENDQVKKSSSSFPMMFMGILYPEHTGKYRGYN